jgi:replication initiation and membrane attachment protein DnaB
MKRKISFILAGSLLLATPAWCLFDFDTLAQLITLVEQGAHQIQLANQVKQNITQAAHFIAHPDWQRTLGIAEQSLGKYAGANDSLRYQQIQQQIGHARQLMSELNGQQPTLESAAALSSLQLETQGMKEKADQLQYTLEYRQRFQQYSGNEGAFGCVSCSIGRLQK